MAPLVKVCSMADVQTALIAKARELLRPSEVKKHKFPAWLRSRLLRTRKEKKWTFQLWDYASSPSFNPDTGTLLRDLLGQLPGSSKWLDHYGSSKYFGQTVFVSEPYPYSLRTEQLTNLDAFSELLGLNYKLDANSWHYPGHTIRVILCEKPLNIP